MITQARLKELLDYDPETGVFTWKESLRGHVKAGDIAGSIRSDGYVRIGIEGSQYHAHRLAHLWMEGFFPEHDIDHRSRNPTDNRWKNLRHVSRQCNSRNSGNPKNNTSGVKGVHWYARKNKWRSQIMVNRECKHLGYYNDFDKAVLARLDAEQRLGWENCDSSSPAYQYATQRGLIT